MTYTSTTAQITQLRRMTGEYPADTSTYTDAELSAIIEARSGDMHAAAYDVWTYKAAAAAALIDWSADGGSYDQSVLYDRYKANAEAEKAQSATLSRWIVDPTLKPVTDEPDTTPDWPEPEPEPEPEDDDDSL